MTDNKGMVPFALKNSTSSEWEAIRSLHAAIELIETKPNQTRSKWTQRLPKDPGVRRAAWLGVGRRLPSGRLLPPARGVGRR
jgi:hypothetical protein